MNRLAFFVEGYTEVVFITKLVEEIAGENRVRIDWRRIQGGSERRRSSSLIRAARADTGQKYYILVFDCGGDHQVKPRIIEEHQDLTRRGYWKIVGIRDVRPHFTHATKSHLLAMLPKYIKVKLAPVVFVLPTLEIEAWFLAEATHFPKIDPAITVETITKLLGFDPQNDDMEQRPVPSEDLNNCYAIGGKTYEKRNAQETVDAIDYALVYMDLTKKLQPLNELCQIINEFLAL